MCGAKRQDRIDVVPMITTGAFSHKPFASIAGLDLAKRALLLLSIDPGLRGAIIAGGAGSGKSSLAHSLRDLLPDRPFIIVPAIVDEAALVGGLDIEATLNASSPIFERGLLASADGGVIFVEGVNRMDPGAASVLASALDEGVVRVEREGLSRVLPSRFVLIGTCDPAEGDIPTPLLSRIGLMVESGEATIDERNAVLEQAGAFDNDREDFFRGFTDETTRLKAKIDEARRSLDEVAISKKDIEELCSSALGLGIEGNRADIFATRAARANAALEGRDAVQESDLIAAIRLTLLPKATALPIESTQKHRVEPPEQPTSESDLIDQQTRDTGTGGSAAASVESFIIRSMHASLPDGTLSDFRRLPNAKGSAGRTRLRHAHSTDSTRGRYFRSSPRRGRRLARIAVDATLREAAPHQRTRRRDTSGRRVIVTARDLRYKEFRRKRGALFIFAVDASGSMALNRLGEAKGAMIKLLERAYIQKDSVALIAFRGQSAEILLSPTRSVELARRSIESLPAGGGTPLAAGLAKALDLGKQAFRRWKVHSNLIVFTDGRANVQLGAAPGGISIAEELSLIGAALIQEGIDSVVIDTRPAFASTGDARRLCELIGGRYIHLPRAEAAAIETAIRLVTS